MKANGDATAEAGLIEPAPFDVIVTVVAFMNVFPPIFTGVIPQVLPLVLLSARAGPFTQPHETVNELPVVVHPEAFRTVIVWLPSATPVNITEV